MTTESEDRLLGLTVLSLLATIGGEVLGMSLLVTIGVTSFALSLVALFALMAVTLVIGVGRLSGPDMHDPILTDRARVPTPPSKR